MFTVHACEKMLTIGAHSGSIDVMEVFNMALRRIVMNLDEDLVKRIDSYAERLHINRTAAAFCFAVIGSRNARILDAFSGAYDGVSGGTGKTEKRRKIIIVQKKKTHWLGKAVVCLDKSSMIIIAYGTRKNKGPVVPDVGRLFCTRRVPRRIGEAFLMINTFSGLKVHCMTRT